MAASEQTAAAERRLVPSRLVDQALATLTQPARRRDDDGTAVADKRMSEDDVVARLRSGMTLGIGGWGSRRKPMSLVRAILRSDLRDLTVVSYGGPDVGLLCAAGKIRRLVFAFVSLDSIALEPHFQAARQGGSIEVTEYDEGMLQWALYAASCRLPFLPCRAGLGSDVLAVNPELRTVRSPYADGTELVAVPALPLDAALVHLNRADAAGNAQFLGDDVYFDDLFCTAAEHAYVSCERIVPTSELAAAGLLRLRVHRWMVAGVVEAPHGAHFTSCDPDYGRDEAFQRAYVTAAKDPGEWSRFAATYLTGDESAYQAAVAALRAEASA
jgi:glutaconate CoA-transferase, subunit A